jgi:hypothetical protein
MFVRFLPALPALLLAGCGQSAPEDDRSLDERFYAAREADCRKYGSLEPDYEVVPIEQVKHILQMRHGGERIMAHLAPEHHCAARKKIGNRTCYFLFASAINAGGGVSFCADLDGKITDFKLDE